LDSLVPSGSYEKFLERLKWTDILVQRNSIPKKVEEIWREKERRTALQGLHVMCKLAASYPSKLYFILLFDIDKN
jgi:hypothetical protein